MNKRYVEVYPLMEFANNMKDKTIDANDIARFPWADVRENVHGHWEEKYDENDDAWCRRKFYCSACGDWNTYGKSKFCPNCGAVMDERKEDE